MKWGNIEQSYPFYGNSVNIIVSITAMSQYVCVLDWSLKVSVPNPKIFE